MKKMLAAVSVATGLAMAGAAFAADQLTNSLDAQPAPVAAQQLVGQAPTESVPTDDVQNFQAAPGGERFQNAPADGQVRQGSRRSGGGQMMDRRGMTRDTQAYGGGQRADGIGNGQGIRQDARRGAGAERGLRGEGRPCGSWAMVVTTGLAWILMLLGIAALVQYLKKDCPFKFNFSFRKKKDAEDAR